MRFLHTSDWHLGQRFLFNHREEEHVRALNWLREVIREEAVDALLVAGDIFDIGNPPNYARRLYYRFLTGLIGSRCRHIIITGGNHDSPAMLDAPRELLQALNVHVIGAVSEELERELVELRKPEGELEAVVAAVPFLRDRDLRPGGADISGMERVKRIQEGIRRHYEELAEKMAPYQKRDVPIIATGHLYATGATASAIQNNIYIGNLENIEPGAFPECFDYVALGHIHRPQIVGKVTRVRYSGSLIPLSFSETKDDKGVWLVDFARGRLKEARFLAAPVFRRLKTIQGTFEEVKDKLLRFHQKGIRDLTPWVEVIVQTDRIIPQLDVQLRDYVREAELDLELLKIRVERPRTEDPETSWDQDLHELEVEEVFRKKCERFGQPPDEMEALLQTFRELREWVQENEERA